MSLPKSLTKAVKQFEESASQLQLKQLDDVERIFKDLVSKGLMSLPRYNLEPISTLPYLSKI